MKDTCIYVANHMDAEPISKQPYKLLRVGASREQSIESDSRVSFDCVGNSISYKNFAYCELTGLYWIWKNTQHDITGLMHYRRYLMSPDSGQPLNAEEIENALDEHDCLVGEPESMIRSVAEHYCYYHIASDLLALTKVMASQPEKYQQAFEEVMSSDKIIPCNMMIAKKGIVDEYCEWLFGILSECEEQIDLYTGRDSYQQRVFGFLAERLMGVWLRANNVKCKFYAIQMNDSGSTEDAPGQEFYSFDRAKGLNGISKAQVFDGIFYLDSYDDVAKVYSPQNSMEHYLQYGIEEGRYPSALYALKDFENLRPELRSKVGQNKQQLFSALMKEAEKEPVILSNNVVLGVSKSRGIDYAPVFDWLYYVNRYDDVPDDYYDTESALKHFIEVGIPQGRQGSKGFSLDKFKKSHPRLEKIIKKCNRAYYLVYLIERWRRNDGIDWRYAD